MSSFPLMISLTDDWDDWTTMSPFYRGPSPNVWRWPSWSRLEKELGAVAKPPVGKDGFQVCMDVKQFKPSELNVKVVDNHVVVEGKHEEREDDHGYITRHFVRRYALPKGYEGDKVLSTLSSDGVLTVTAPKPQIADKANERVIQIQQVGPAHLNVKDNAKEAVKEAGEKKATK